MRKKLVKNTYERYTNVTTIVPPQQLGQVQSSLMLLFLKECAK